MSARDDGTRWIVDTRSADGEWVPVLIDGKRHLTRAESHTALRAHPESHWLRPAPRTTTRTPTVASLDLFGGEG